MKRRAFGVLLLTLAFAPARAVAEGQDPAELIRATVDEAFALLRDPALKKRERRAERLAKLRTIADRVFDWEQMAQSSLGAAYRKLSEPQRVEFLALFTDLIARDYRDDLDRFMGDERVVIKGVDKRDEQRVVKTILITHSRDQVPIDYFMHPDGTSWKAHDFAVEGVSLVNHYRKSFARFLANNSVEDLLARLRARAK